MRTLNDHQVNPANDALIVTVEDEPGSGGANHLYRIIGFNTSTNASDPFDAWYVPLAQHTTLLFQNGPINEVGVNGITHEALISILIDRMRGFQSGPFANADNAEALLALEHAMIALLRRTKARMARGVEGTHTI
jgi:hypothetical protein